MNYSRILQVVYGEPWGILPATHEVIQQTLATHIQGTQVRLPEIRNHFNAQALSLQAPRSRDSRVYRSGAMALIPVSGIIGKNLSMMESMCGGYNIDQLARDVEEAGADASIQNVLFAFDSPGGRVTGVPETAALIAKLGKTKHTVAFTDDMAASAAYWLYSQANDRYLSQTGIVGSVGVIVVALDRTKQLEMQGITPTIVKAGEHKGAGLPGNPMTAEQVQMIQDQVNMIYDAMVADIHQAHSGISDSSLQGQTFLGNQALDAKMADGISTLEALVKRLS